MRGLAVSCAVVACVWMGCSEFQEPTDTDSDGGAPVVNECSSNAGNCDETPNCIAASDVCVCEDGFDGDGDTCSDVDECAVGAANCDENATCTNTPGGFACACNSGFVGNGTACERPGVAGALTAESPGIWADGALAVSCRQYRTPPEEYQYSGATGDGIYRIDPDAVGPLDPINVFCDMTTDDGGWTRVVDAQDNTSVTNSATVSPAELAAGTTTNYAKLSDVLIRTLATSGDLEYQMAKKDRSAVYVQRVSADEWNAFSSTAWTNVRFDSKASDGNWVMDACNGHFNNRGFSSYSDLSQTQCMTVFEGSPLYMNTFHVTAGGTINAPFYVYVR